MRTKSLLDRKPDAGADDIAAAFHGHICRCTGYKKIEDAVKLAAALSKSPESMEPQWIDPEILEKATGEALYTDDYRVPGLLHAKVLRSQVASGDIVRFDPEPARRAPGVAGVFTLADVPGEKFIGRALKDQPVFAHNKIRYLGEPVALAVATSPEAAEKALKKIILEVNPHDPIKSPEEALADGAPALHTAGNVCWSRSVRKGDVDEAFRKAAAIVSDTFETPFNEHLYLETDSGLAYWDEEDRLVLLIATQEIHEIRKLLAACLHMDIDKVRVIQTATGGAFGGRKVCPFPVIVSLAAYHLKAPVRLTYTREETFLDSTKRHPFRMRYQVAADESGKLSALKADIAADTGAYASYGPPVLGRALAHAASIYEIPNVFIQAKMIYTNNPVAGAMRGFGATQVHFAMESMIDRLAQALSLDPVDFRRQNMLRPGALTITSEILDSDTQVAAVVETAAKEMQAARSRKRETTPAPETDSGWRRGVGMACHWFGMGTTKPHDASEIRISLAPDGRVEIGAGVADMGQGSTATLRTIAAQRLGVSPNDIRIIHNDTTLTADSGPSNASRQTYFSGRALIDGLDKLVAALSPSAAKIMNARADGVQFTGGYFFSLHDPESRVTLQQLAAAANEEDRLPTVMGRFEARTVPMHPDTGKGKPYEKYICGAHVAELDVNLKSGEIRLLRIISIHDIGKMISRKRVEGQIEGCTAMAIGFTLIEEYIPGLTNRLKNYPVPRMRDIPEIQSILIETPGDSDGFAAKGIGESGLISVAPAIVNAVFDATGACLNRLPATQKEVRKALLKNR